MLKCFFGMAIPNMTSNVLSFVMILTNSIFAGHLKDPSMLAAVGLGNVTCMICIVTLYMGLNAAQETLTSQAFGSNNFHRCGQLLNRGLLINTIVFIPLALGPTLYGESIFIALK